MNWVRIDNRLVHGQIIETWLPYTRAASIMVVNDDVAEDVLTQEIMSLAIPQSTGASFVAVDAIMDYVDMQRWRTDDDPSLVLFSGLADAKRAFENGFSFRALNVGNIHYGPGKKQLKPSVAVSADDENCLTFFKGCGVKLDFRCVPNDPIQVRW